MLLCKRVSGFCQDWLVLGGKEKQESVWCLMASRISGMMMVVEKHNFVWNSGSLNKKWCKLYFFTAASSVSKWDMSCETPKFHEVFPNDVFLSLLLYSCIIIYLYLYILIMFDVLWSDKLCHHANEGIFALFLIICPLHFLNLLSHRHHKNMEASASIFFIFLSKVHLCFVSCDKEK